jgi:hypothetical protein
VLALVGCALRTDSQPIAATAKQWLLGRALHVDNGS